MHPVLLVLGGVVLGAAGSTLVKSAPVHKAAVRTTACALHCKNAVEDAIEGAKAECDDILAEAEQLALEESSNGKDAKEADSAK